MAMQLSAIMNLTGNFAAQIQKNLDSMKGITDQAKQAGNSIKTAFSESNIGQGLTKGLAQTRDALGAAGIASAGFLKTCVDSAAGAQKINSALEQTIKSTGGAAGLTANDVSKMASSLSDATGISGGLIKSGQDMLLTFTSIGKDVFPQTTEAMLDMATQFKMDPTSAAMMLGKALNDPAKGLSALQREGVKLDPILKQQAITMQESGNIAGAQKIILKELGTEMGGQARAAGQTMRDK